MPVIDWFLISMIIIFRLHTLRDVLLDWIRPGACCVSLIRVDMTPCARIMIYYSIDLLNRISD